MKPLLILLTVFFLSSLVTYLFNQHVIALQLSARIAMAAMLVFTSVAHFAFWKGMVLMLPKFIPFKKQVVYFTGIIELLAAVGLLIPQTVQATGVALIIFFVAILPSNINAAMQHVNLEKADYSGSGIRYLWFRVPLQLFLIAWVLYSAVLL